MELGTGQGVGLCLLAAANPQAEFLGVDFHPAHIAHAQDLAETAGLTNIRFVEADFIELAAHWPADFGTFDYVALHGIYSWVPVEVRKTVVDCLAHAARPGSLVYNSYNTQPGWLSTVPFQHLASRLKNVAGQTSDAALGNAIELFDKLAAADAEIFKAMPPLKMRLDSIRDKNSSYLSQEYLHESWHPMWHSEVARELERAKLSYIGTATLIETMLPAVLGPKMQGIIQEQPHPQIRQDMQDIVINQTFRRDIFCRGRRSDTVHQNAIGTTLLHLLSAPNAEGPLSAKASFGKLALDRPIVTAIVDALAVGPKSIDAIAALPGVKEKGRKQVVRLLLLMIHARILVVGAVEPGSGTVAQRFNAAAACAASQGLPYRYLATEVLGSGATVRDIDLMMIDCWLQSSGRADVAAIAQGTAARLAALGRDVEQDGKVLKGADAASRLATLAAIFLGRLLPEWRRLGMLA
ncbi:MAG: class I SAM-dependent methyltransferase [Pseudomonadota bacterium]